jgi:hypothetical protein
MGERIGAYGVWVWKPDGKRQLGRQRRGWEDNIKMGLYEVDWARTGLIWFGIGKGGGHL